MSEAAQFVYLIWEPKRSQHRSLWDFVLKPLCVVWTGAAMGELKRHLVVFRPGIYPNIIGWMTYPFTSLMESIYQYIQKTMATSAQATSAGNGNRSENIIYYANLVAALERTVAVAYTGSSVPLLRECMEPLWLTLGLKRYSYPWLNPSIIRITSEASETGYIQITPSAWPLNNNGVAASAAARTLELTFGSKFAKVRILPAID